MPPTLYEAAMAALGLVLVVAALPVMFFVGNVVVAAPIYFYQWIVLP